MAKGTRVSERVGDLLQGHQNLLAVTTFHKAGESYGLRCLETLAKHFPGRILFYFEEPPADLTADFWSRVEMRGFSAIPGVNDYLERLKRHPGADGQGPNGYDYRYDANKFCRKVFVQDAVFDEDQYVFWFDADTVVLKDLSEKMLTALVAEHPFAYLGRNGEKTYTETGFLGFNTKHERFQEFRKKYLDYFTSGRIFSQLKGWHDCIAFDHARHGIEGRNLTPHGSGMGNVIGDSPLREYVVHNKGPRKFSDARKRAFG